MLIGSGLRGGGRRHALRAGARRRRVVRRDRLDVRRRRASRSLGLVAFAATTAAGATGRPATALVVVSMRSATDGSSHASGWSPCRGLLFGNLSVLVPLRLSHLGYSGAGDRCRVPLLRGARGGQQHPRRPRLRPARHEEADPRRARGLRDLRGPPALAQRGPSARNPRRPRKPRLRRVLHSRPDTLTRVAEARGLDYGYAFALVNLAWAPGETIGAAGGGGSRTRPPTQSRTSRSR